MFQARHVKLVHLNLGAACLPNLHHRHERESERERERDRDRDRDRQADRQTGRQADRQTDAERQRDRETERRMDGRTDGRRDGETARQRERETENKDRDGVGREGEGRGVRERARGGEGLCIVTPRPASLILAPREPIRPPITAMGNSIVSHASPSSRGIRDSGLARDWGFTWRVGGLSK